jgi:hypothetical protein
LVLCISKRFEEELKSGDSEGDIVDLISGSAFRVEDMYVWIKTIRICGIADR